MINLEKFRQIVEEYFAVKGNLPNIEFKNNISLADSIQRIVGSSSNYKATMDDVAALNLFVDEISNSQNDNLLTAPAFEELDRVAEVFAINMNKTFQDLRQIKDLVGRISTSIEDINNDLITQDPVLRVHMNEDVSEASFNVIDWNDISAMGPASNIVAIVNERCSILATDRYRDNTPASIRAIETNISRHLPLSRNSNKLVFEQIDLDKEYRQTLVDVLKSSLKDTIEDDIRDFIKLVTRQNAMNGLANKVLKAFTDGKEYGAKVASFLEVIKSQYPVFEAINSDILELPEEIKSKVVNNMTIVQEYFECMAYYTIMCRRKLYVDSIMLDNQMINPDNMDEFKELGGSYTDLANLLNQTYKHHSVPTKGITVNQIKSLLDEVRNRADKEAARKASEVKMRSNNAIVGAFKVGLRKYVKDMKDSGEYSYIGNIESVIKTTAEKHIVNDYSVEDSVYNFTIQTMYEGTLVETLYNKLGRAYLKQLSISSEVSGEDINTLEAGVVAEMITSFIVKNFMKPTEAFK